MAENAKISAGWPDRPKAETAARLASHALGLSHCKIKPCQKVGVFCFSIANSGFEVAIL